MENGVIEEKKDSFARLTDVIYSAGMDEESEELQEIWNELVEESDRLNKVIYDMGSDIQRYRKALQKIVCLNIPMPDEVFEIANNALEECE